VNVSGWNADMRVWLNNGTGKDRKWPFYHCLYWLFCSPSKFVRRGGFNFQTLLEL